MDKIINKLIEFREEKGWSQKEFADKLGLPVEDVIEFEKGQNLKVLERIVDFFIRAHTKENIYNDWWTIDDLPFTEEQKKIVLEWFARRIQNILRIFDPEWGAHCKSYDPLIVEDEAFSYVFDLQNGGRQHPYESLQQLENRLEMEAVKEMLPYVLDRKVWLKEVKPRLLEWVKENFPHDTVEWILSYDEWRG